MKVQFKNYRLLIFILIGVVIGIVAGLIAGPKASVVAPLGDVFIYILFTLVTPLAFILVTGSIASLADMRKLGKTLGLMLGIYVVTGIIASLLMILACWVYPPSAGFSVSLKEFGDVPEAITKFTPDMLVKIFFVPDFVQILSRNHILPLIIFCILIGIGISLTGERGKPIADFLSRLSDVMIKVVEIIMWYAPIGIGCYFAALVGQWGGGLITSAIRYFILAFSVGIIYWVVGYSALAFISGGKEGFKRWWRYIPLPAVTALGTSSSVATIPFELDAARRIGVPKYIRDLCITIGSTIHMDGACLATILKIAFLCGIFGYPFFTLNTLTMSVLLAVCAAVAFSGIPGGGNIGQIMIISIFGFPPEALPLIVALGALTDPLDTAINSTGDTLASMLCARILEGKNWRLKGEREEM